MVEFPELLILRHGETEWNREGRMQGNLDSPLTDTGRAHAERQRDILSRFDLEGYALYCSPLGRTRETAKISLPEVALSAVDFNDALVEIGVGEWAGADRSSLKPTVVLETTPDGPLGVYDSAPGGEGYVGLRDRCTGFLAALTGPSVIITHGITSRMLRVIYLGQKTRLLGEVGGGQGVVYHMKDGEQTRLG